MSTLETVLLIATTKAPAKAADLINLKLRKVIVSCTVLLDFSAPLVPYREIRSRLSPLRNKHQGILQICHAFASGPPTRMGRSANRARLLTRSYITIAPAMPSK